MAEKNTERAQSRATTEKPEDVRVKPPSQEDRVKAQEEDSTEFDQHESHVPTEEDYERARTTGAGREPELPPGVVKDRGRGKK
jgi:hypothetical protein